MKPDEPDHPAGPEGPSADALPSSPAPLCGVPLRERPRETFERMGARHVPDAVLLAILMRSGVRGCNVIELAREILARYGSLSALARASVRELSRIRGVGRVKAQVLHAALELSRRMAEEEREERPRMASPASVAALLRDDVLRLENEVFWVLLLDARHRLLSPPNLVTRGLLDSSLVHPREVFREAVRSSAAAVIVAHNHPSGDPEPSAGDLAVTRKLIAAGRIMDIRLLDHVICVPRDAGTGREYLSLRAAGLLNFEEGSEGCG
ncbi:RadC family protein [Kiritimatiella glycovorans]|uniref:DNA repair protein RadC n=1 Tax=Kiritimatiella glycovorans TaxID=1307763 RepID=A0A0G3EFC7_9BACT|nr:DNA repair protein RadC [Kiritimatiella glycovorans]AKJ64132.1 DNA repair protein RadC [Kiritimatiella glycovorans]